MSLRATNAVRLRTGAKATKQSTDDLAASHGLLRSPAITVMEPPTRMTGSSSPAPEVLIERPPGIGAVERKSRHVDLELLAVLALHLVPAGHEARCGLQRHAAGVFEPLARCEHRLLADYPFAADFLPMAGGVGDDPVPGPELHCLVASVGDHDGVRPEILAFFNRRAFRQEVRLHCYFDLAGDGAVHASVLYSDSMKAWWMISKNPVRTNRRSQRSSMTRKCSRSFQHSSDPERRQATESSPDLLAIALLSLLAVNE